MTRKAPFEIVASRVAYENPWIQLFEHRIKTRSGRDGLYGILKCRHHGVAVIPYEAGNIWLVGQYRVSLESHTWEIPKGGSPPPETPVETARRELREETGFDASEFLELGRLHLANSLTDERAVIVLARGLRPGPSAPDETEEFQLRKISLEEAYAAAKSGELTDAVTVYAILRLVLMRSEGLL